MARRKIKRCLYAVSAVILFGFIATGGPARGVNALLLLLDISAGERPSLLKKSTPSPTRTLVTWHANGKSYRGDLYRPGSTAQARLLLIPGAAEAGKDDSRLVAFATTLTRGRFTVLVPDLEGLKKLQVQSGDVREVTDSFRHLVSVDDVSPAGRGGMCAFSYAVGPALLASLSPEIREQVRFIMGVGGYYDLPQVLAYFTTGYFVGEKGWQHRTPNEYGKWVFVSSNLQRVSNLHDRELLRLIVARKMADAGAGVEDLATRLGPEGRSFYDFILNREPSRVGPLISRLPAEVRHEIEALDLANKDLSLLKAKLVLVHGLDDNIVPYPQSQALARAVRRGQAELFLAKGLFHVEVKAGVLDGWQLWRGLVALLRERDREN